jgi:hypothetical protein
VVQGWLVEAKTSQGQHHQQVPAEFGPVNEFRIQQNDHCVPSILQTAVICVHFFCGIPLHPHLINISI